MPGFEEEGRASDTFETIPTESQYLPNGIIHPPSYTFETITTESKYLPNGIVHPPQTCLRPSLLSLNIFPME